MLVLTVMLVVIVPKETIT